MRVYQGKWRRRRRVVSRMPLKRLQVRKERARNLLRRPNKKKKLLKNSQPNLRTSKERRTR